ncbi:MAG: V-type ATP synthase subunit F [Oscillospiraceae bacterium]|jgi:V/A-type H+-transporting ATPase subunit F|nr:V-type ATP synthase subunit F [Oscillospiraceae bacterium]
MYRVAAMGDADSVAGLSALGVEVFPVEEAGEAARQLRSLAGGGCAVVYVTEALAARIPEEIERYRYARVPAVILIPGIRGNTGAGLRNISVSVEKAVGSDIIS